MPNRAVFRARLAVLACALLPAVPAAAEDLGFWGLTATGTIGAGIEGDDTGTRLFLHGDANLELPIVGGFGLGLGLLGMATDVTGSPDTPHETYGTVMWKADGFTLSLGVPRPAYDQFVLSPLEGYAPVRGLAADRMGASRSRVTWGAIYDGGLPMGLSLAGTSAMPGGDLGWAVSAHEMGDLRLASAALGWEGDGFAAGGALEWASDGTLAGKAQLRRDIGAISLGVSAFAAPAPGVPDMAEAFVTWRARPGLSFAALAQAPREGPGLGAVSGAWDFGNGATLQGAVIGEDGHMGASLGLDFRF